SVSGQIGAFMQSGLLPNLIPSFDPVAILDASFPNVNGSTFLAGTGENLTIPNVADAPQFLLSFNSSVAPKLEGQSFVLAILDPDAPTPENRTLANAVHMVASDVTFNSTLTTFVPLYSSTPALAAYLSPTPPPGAPHRYTALLYLQPDNFAHSAAPLIPEDRIQLDWQTFTMTTGLGSPIAGTYFQTGQD
ncbi:phosphatidylethanolamine-binding protein, partial [Vararia minispora EC-137]